MKWILSLTMVLTTSMTMEQNGTQGNYASSSYNLSWTSGPYQANPNFDEEFYNRDQRPDPLLRPDNPVPHNESYDDLDISTQNLNHSNGNRSFNDTIKAPMPTKQKVIFGLCSASMGLAMGALYLVLKKDR